MIDEKTEKMVGDLAALVRQLVQQSRKHNAGNALAGRAADYLQRNGLSGSPLRSDGHNT